MTTSNPYDPKSPPSPASPVLPAPGHPPVARLVAAGATPDEVAEAQRRWGEMTEHERWQSTDAMNVMTDEDLREQIQEGRADSASPAFGDQAPEGTVAEVRAWIGDDPGRAQIALDAEVARPRVRRAVTDYANAVLSG